MRENRTHKRSIANRRSTDRRCGDVIVETDIYFMTEMLFAQYCNAVIPVSSKGLLSPK